MTCKPCEEKRKEFNEAETEGCAPSSADTVSVEALKELITQFTLEVSPENDPTKFDYLPKDHPWHPQPSYEATIRVRWFGAMPPALRALSGEGGERAEAHPAQAHDRGPRMTEAGIPTAPARYGNRRVPKMYAEINTLRRAIAAEGTPAIQDAWGKVEEHIDFAYGRLGNDDNNGEI